MIRRVIRLLGQPPQWLLTTQVEHARVSASLAERCLRHFGQSIETREPHVQSARSELLAAIFHHDDGWADWDAHPQLDAEHLRPLSFRELQQEISLPIWSSSIAGAARVGPLAAWIVAGHFLALLPTSGQPITSQATSWKKEMTEQRAKWLADWQAIDPTLHSCALADEALLWLQLFDHMSLWLCSVCPGRDEYDRDVPPRLHTCRADWMETEFCCQQGLVRIKPWRFHDSDFKIEAAGWVVPIREYGSLEALFAARVNHSVQWDFAG